MASAKKKVLGGVLGSARYEKAKGFLHRACSSSSGSDSDELCDMIHGLTDTRRSELGYVMPFAAGGQVDAARGYLREQLRALVMGGHLRLGAKSAVRHLSQDLLRRIAEFHGFEDIRYMGDTVVTVAERPARCADAKNQGNAAYALGDWSTALASVASSFSLLTLPTPRATLSPLRRLAGAVSRGTQAAYTQALMDLDIFEEGFGSLDQGNKGQKMVGRSTLRICENY